MGWLNELVRGGRRLVGRGPIEELFADALGDIPQPGPDLDRDSVARSVFFGATFALLGKMAHADGEISLGEITAVDAFIEALGCDARARRVATRIFTTAKDSPHSFDAFAREFATAFAGKHLLREEMIEILYQVAMADGILHPEEEKLLRRAEKILQISKETSHHLRAVYLHEADEHYAMLRCAPDDPPEVIRARYHELREANDPAHIIADGLPEEFAGLATKKIGQLDHAFGIVCPDG